MQQYSSSVMQSYFGKCPLAALQGDSTNDRLTPRRPPWNGASASACKTIPPRLRAYRSTTQSVVYRATVTNSRRGRGSAPARRCRTMPPGLLDQNKSLQINNAPRHIRLNYFASLLKGMRPRTSGTPVQACHYQHTSHACTRCSRPYPGVALLLGR